MRLISKIAAILFVIAGSVQSSASDEDTVRGLMKNWLDAYNTKNIEALMSLYSDQIYYANNGSDLERSTASIRQSYAAQFKAATGITIDFSEELINVGPKLAHIAGKYRVNIPQKDGTSNHTYGRVLLIFEKQSEGWKLIVDFDNNGSDLGAKYFL